jgi:hypothetical protein
MLLRLLIPLYAVSVVVCILLIAVGVPMIAIFLMVAGWVGGFTFVFILSHIFIHFGQRLLPAPTTLVQ